MALGQSNPVAQLGASQQMPYTLSYRSAQALAGKRQGLGPGQRFSCRPGDDPVPPPDDHANQGPRRWIADEEPLEDFDPKRSNPFDLPGLSRANRKTRLQALRPHHQRRRRMKRKAEVLLLRNCMTTPKRPTQWAHFIFFRTDVLWSFRWPGLVGLESACLGHPSV